MTQAVDDDDLLVDVTAFLLLCEAADDDDDDIAVYQPQGKSKPTNIYRSLRGTANFKHWVGIEEPLYDYIAFFMRDRLLEPRTFNSVIPGSKTVSADGVPVLYP